MRYGLIVVLVSSVLAGCSDPLRDVPRLSDVEPAATEEAPVGFFQRMFAAQPETVSADATATSAARPGLFASLFGPRDEGAQESVPGDGQAAPPFAQIAQRCGLPRSQLGQRIDRHSNLTIWDSAPGATAPRPHYITGFADGCAREFTAALVMRGDPVLHEAERYSSRAPYTEVDSAYERIKRQVCGVGRGTPCGRGMDRLDRQLVMVSAYDRFGSGAKAATILIHNGNLVSIGLRER